MEGCMYLSGNIFQYWGTPKRGTHFHLQNISSLNDLNTKRNHAGSMVILLLKYNTGENHGEKSLFSPQNVLKVSIFVSKLENNFPIL